MKGQIAASRPNGAMARGLAIWLLIMFAESVHGTLRELFLTPIVGEVRARLISFFVALAIIFTITLLFIRWIAASNAKHLLKIGALWAGLTFCFEALIVRAITDTSWSRLLADYDPSQGGLMLVGLAFLVLAPVAADSLLKYFRPVKSDRPS